MDQNFWDWLQSLFRRKAKQKPAPKNNPPLLPGDDEAPQQDARQQGNKSDQPQAKPEAKPSAQPQPQQGKQQSGQNQGQPQPGQSGGQPKNQEQQGQSQDQQGDAQQGDSQSAGQKSDGQQSGDQQQSQQGGQQQSGQQQGQQQSGQSQKGTNSQQDGKSSSGQSGVQQGTKSEAGDQQGQEGQAQQSDGQKSDGQQRQGGQKQRGQKQAGNKQKGAKPEAGKKSGASAAQSVGEQAEASQADSQKDAGQKQSKQSGKQKDNKKENSQKSKGKQQDVKEESGAKGDSDSGESSDQQEGQQAEAPQDAKSKSTPSQQGQRPSESAKKPDKKADKKSGGAEAKPAQDTAPDSAPDSANDAGQQKAAKENKSQKDADQNSGDAGKPSKEDNKSPDQKSGQPSSQDKNKADGKGNKTAAAEDKKAQKPENSPKKHDAEEGPGGDKGADESADKDSDKNDAKAKAEKGKKQKSPQHEKPQQTSSPQKPDSSDDGEDETAGDEAHNEDAIDIADDDGIDVDEADEQAMSSSRDASRGQRPSRPGKMRERDIDLGRQANGQWRNLSERLKELRTVIGRVTSYFEDVRKEQVRTIQRKSNRHLKSDGDMSEIDLDEMVRERTRDRARRSKTESTKYYRDTRDNKVEIQADIVFLIDGSQSMSEYQPASGTTNMRSAIQTVAITRAAAKETGMDTTALVYGAEETSRVKVLATPEMDDHKVGENLAAVQNGGNWGTKVAPGLVKMLYQLSKQELPSNKMCAGANIVIVNDGDTQDFEETLAVLMAMHTYAPEINVTFAIQHTDTNTDMHKLAAKYAQRTRRNYKDVCFTTIDPNEMPLHVAQMIKRQLERQDGFVQKSGMRQQNIEDALRAAEQVYRKPAVSYVAGPVRPPQGARVRNMVKEALEITP